MANSQNNTTLISIKLVESNSKFLSNDSTDRGKYRVTTILELPEQREIKEPPYIFHIFLEINVEGYTGEDFDEENVIFQIKCKAKGTFIDKNKKAIVAKDVLKEKDKYASLLNVWCKNYIDNELGHSNFERVYIPWDFEHFETVKMTKSQLSKKKRTKKKTRKKTK